MTKQCSAFVTIMVIALALSTVDCATNQKAIANEKLFNALAGTWVSTDPTYEFKKIVSHPDGTQKLYGLESSTQPTREGKYTFVLESWIDDNGVFWYKAIFETGVWKGYVLGRIADSGNTWEAMEDVTSYPKEWDTNIYKVRKYIRR